MPSELSIRGSRSKPRRDVRCTIQRADRQSPTLPEAWAFPQIHPLLFVSQALGSMLPAITSRPKQYSNTPRLTALTAEVRISQHFGSIPADPTQLCWMNFCCDELRIVTDLD